MRRTVILEKLRLVVLFAALGLTVVACATWFLPGSTTTIRDANGEWLGVDCSGDEAEARSFNPQPYRLADAEQACDDLAASQMRTSVIWSVLAVVAWMLAFVVARIPEHRTPVTSS